MSTEPFPLPDWAVPGAPVALIEWTEVGHSVVDTHIAKIGKRDVVLADGARLTRRDVVDDRNPRRYPLGIFRPDAPEVAAARLEMRRRHARREVKYGVHRR